MTPRVYCRCNSGHYFLGDSCPLDGWSSPASEELHAAVSRFQCSGKKVSLEALKRAGLSEAALQRAVVIEFGDDSNVFEAVSPEGYVVGGEWKTLAEVGQSFK